MVGRNGLLPAKFDIIAKAENDDPANPTAERVAHRQRLQSFLADRFNFKFHTATSELLIYALVVRAVARFFVAPVRRIASPVSPYRAVTRASVNTSFVATGTISSAQAAHPFCLSRAQSSMRGDQ